MWVFCVDSKGAWSKIDDSFLLLAIMISLIRWILIFINTTNLCNIIALHLQVSIIVWFSENAGQLIIMKIILSTVYVNKFLNEGSLTVLENMVFSAELTKGIACFSQQNLLWNHWIDSLVVHSLIFFFTNNRNGMHCNVNIYFRFFCEIFWFSTTIQIRLIFTNNH